MVIFVNNFDRKSENWCKYCELEFKFATHFSAEKDTFTIHFYGKDDWSEMAKKLTDIGIDYSITFKDEKAVLTIKTIDAFITGGGF